MKLEELTLNNNLELHRLELQVDENIAFIEYKILHDLLFLIHTEVPASLQGKGIAGIIVRKALEYAKENNYKIVPICSFVQSYLEKHQEWRELVAPNAERFLHKK